MVFNRSRGKGDKAIKPFDFFGEGETDDTPRGVKSAAESLLQFDRTARIFNRNL